MGLFDFLFASKKENKKPAHKLVNLNGVRFRYSKNKKSKSIKITVKDPQTVNISLPLNCSYKTAMDFVYDKMNWIQKNLELFEFKKIDENHKTKTNNFIVQRGIIQKPVIKSQKGIISFIYPFEKDFYSNEIQSEAKKALKKALYLEAKEYLPKRLNEIAEKFGFKYNKLSLKSHKTRWGSCSYKNNINLNINLMNLEDDFIDYVLIHELAHTVEKNHKENFWKIVNTCMPNAGEIRKKLKKISPVV